LRPLEGKRVLVTRPRDQAHDLVDRLERLGAMTIVLPAIAIAPPEDLAPLNRALGALEQYDWVVLTSVNGVRAVKDRLEALGIPSTTLAERRLAVIGPSTAAATEEAFRKPDIVPSEFVSEAIAEALGEVRGQRFLLARADIARKDLAVILRERGADVEEVAAYRIVPSGEADLDPRQPAPDYITLTSSSAVHGTLARLREKGVEGWMRQAELVSIGPITSATIEDLGLRVAVSADEYTIPGLVEALVKHNQREAANA